MTNAATLPTVNQVRQMTAAELVQLITDNGHRLGATDPTDTAMLRDYVLATFTLSMPEGEPVELPALNAVEGARAYLRSLQALLVNCGYSATDAHIIDTRQGVAKWLSRPVTDDGLPAAIVISEAPDSLQLDHVLWDGMVLTLQAPKLAKGVLDEPYASYALAFYNA